MDIRGRSLVFLGTPPAAATVLRRLVDSGISIAHVVTRPDAKRGRGSTLTPSPVKEVAQECGLPVSHDLSWIDEHAHENLFGIVVAYGRIIPTALLEKVPMINVHFSLLPRWRGAAPVERALLEGDAVTGVCIMNVEPTLDTGAVFASAEVPIAHTSTTESLTHDLALVGSDLLLQCVTHGLGEPVPQADGATYAAKISREELRIDWTCSAESIHRRIRALRAFTMLGATRMRILQADVASGVLPPGNCNATGAVGTGDGVLQLQVVQPEGKAAMDVASWLRGRPTDEPITFS